MISPNRKKRSKYCIAFFLLLLIEVLIALFVHDAFIRPYVGDVLVVVVIYCFIRIWISDRCRLLPLYIFLFAAAVEGLQYLDLTERLGLESGTFLAVLVGSVADWKDVVCYAVGCMLLGIYEVLHK